ncbi:unnamed protein product [Symbiodinium sp. CCMP2592]|nr:unnamed protein product [Symbiodinium sp. CCMP2592]
MTGNRAYTVCAKCGAWVWSDRIGADKLECCKACGQRWPGVKRGPAARVWKDRAVEAARPQRSQPRSPGPKIHKALLSLWDKFSPEVQQGLVAAGWKPKEESKPEPPPGLPFTGFLGSMGKGKGKGKHPEMKDSGAATQALWASASPEQKSLLQQLGFQDPNHAEPADLKSLVKAHMDQLPDSLKKAIESLEPRAPEPTATELMLSATKKFKSSSSELRQLIQKSAGLQIKIDRAKAVYADLLDQMKNVQTELSDKQSEVTQLQKDLEAKVQSGAESPSVPDKATVLLALTQCGITLSSEQQALLEGSMDIDTEQAPAEATRLSISVEGPPASNSQPQGIQQPVQDGTREKPRSRSRGRTQG